MISTGISEVMNERQHKNSERSHSLWPIVTACAGERCLIELRAKQIQRFAIETSLSGPWRVRDSILFLTPPAKVSDACEIASRSICYDVIATVDHFVQVETLQRQAHKFQTNVQVLVIVNSGANFFGCRAGTEALQLAQAVASQTNLRFHGITTELTASQSNADTINTLAAVSALLNTEAKLKCNGLTCPMMHVRGHAEFESNGLPQHWHISLPAPKLDQIAKCIESSKAPPSGSLRHFAATVVSRPSLEFAVLDCGFDMTGPAKFILLTDRTRLPVRQIDRHRCVVDVSGAIVEFAIGQQILVTADNETGSS